MAVAAPPERSFLKRVEEEGGAMSFFDHLVELRKRIISALLSIGVGMVAGLAVARPFINFVSRPMFAALRKNHVDPNMYYTHPAGYVSLYISIGLYLGIALAMPWVLYQIWLFVAPGLYKHERKAVASFIGSSMLLFACGVAFGYYVMLPQVLTFVIAFADSGTVGSIKPLIDINEYFDLILLVLVGLGVIFEMPVVVFILSLFNIVTPRFLLKNFRYAMLLITVAAAIVTPTPDATTMLVFMAPMIALYFVSVLVSYLVLRRKRGQSPPEGQAA
jgi:sec-independent protein translocase protein TatC